VASDAPAREWTEPTFQPTERQLRLEPRRDASARCAIAVPDGLLVPLDRVVDDVRAVIGRRGVAIEATAQVPWAIVAAVVSALRGCQVRFTALSP
jgi:hypothetical protein